MDLRIKKTYRALFEAFTELLEEHRFEDVTVAMLCDRAMIRRTTFYKHFRDKNDYFAFYIDELMSGLPQKRADADGAEGASVMMTYSSERAKKIERTIELREKGKR